MSNNNTKKNSINFGEKKINISQRFTLIQGKFAKDILLQYKQLGLYDMIQSYDIIPLKTIINFYKSKINTFSELDKSINLTDLLIYYNDLMQNNENLLINYSGVIKNYNELYDYIQLLNKKGILLKELELSKIKEKSSNFSAKSDLLNKLSQSIKDTQNQLSYFEEDYLKIKTKRNQINASIEEKKLQINNLNKEKKNCFSKINAITRGMEDDSYSKNNNDSPNQQPASERIKSLQIQAKEAQFKIKKTQSNINELELKQEKIELKFQKLDNDYQKLQDVLNKDTSRLNALKMELSKGMNDKTNSMIVDLSQMNEIRSPPEIELDLEIVNKNINSLLEENKIFQGENIDVIFNKLDENFNKFQSEFTKTKKDITLNNDQDQLMNIIGQFRNLESLIIELQSIVNAMLSEISINVIFTIVIEENSKEFSLNFKFKRSNKEDLDFESLTTPEKIFFIISLNIAIQIQLDQNKIIFSNLFVQNDFNKRGSIYRTIRKIIPILEKEKKFKDRLYIFVLSNLEMKKSIENLSIIKIED